MKFTLLKSFLFIKKGHYVEWSCIKVPKSPHFKEKSYNYFFPAKSTKSSSLFNSLAKTKAKSAPLKKFILNVFYYKISFFFISSGFFTKVVKAYNWSFNKSSLLLSIESEKQGYLSFFNKTRLVSIFFREFKSNLFFVFDSLLNVKLLFFFKRIKKPSISVPFSNKISWIISWPVYYDILSKGFVTNHMHDFVLFKEVITLKKLSVSNIV